MTDKQKESIALASIAMRHMASLGAHSTDAFQVDFIEAADILDKMLVDDERFGKVEIDFSREIWATIGEIRFGDYRVTVETLTNKRQE